MSGIKMNNKNKIIIALSLIIIASASFDTQAMHRFSRLPFKNLLGRRSYSTIPSETIKEVPTVITQDAAQKASLLVDTVSYQTKEILKKDRFIKKMYFKQKLLAGYAFLATGVAAAYHHVTDGALIKKTMDFYSDNKNALNDKKNALNELLFGKTTKEKVPAPEAQATKQKTPAPEQNEIPKK